MMIKTQPNNNPPPSLKPFPTKQLLIYWVAQIGLGTLLSIPNLENLHWINELLTPLDNVFSTFRTAFVQSPTPIASKLFLVIWWLAILPWGLVFSFQWTQGFKPHPNGLKMPYTSLLWLLAAALIVGYMFGSLLLIHDYSYYWMIDKPNSPRRGDLVPALMTNGPFTLSLWIAVSSFVFILALAMVPYVFRTILNKILAK